MWSQVKGDVISIRTVVTRAFAHGYKWQCAALTFAHSDNNAACACLALFEATVYAINLGVGRANVTTKVCAINLNMTVQHFAGLHFRCHGFAQLVRQNERRFVLAIQIARQLHHADTLGGVHKQADRGQQVHKSILRLAKIVPEVTLNWCAHALHLNLRRVVIL